MLKKEDVLYVAKLARLKLKDEELEIYSTQLSAVFDSFEEIDKIDLNGVAETSQSTGLENIFRQDSIQKIENQTNVTTDELLKNTPLKDGNKILVPKVIEK